MSATPTSHLSPNLKALSVSMPQRAKRVDVVLGMSQRNCRFHGICRIEKHLKPEDTANCGCQDIVPGWLLRPEPGFCVLMLWRGRLPDEREKYHFARETLELNDALNVSAFYRTLGMGELYLRSGSYAIRTTPNYYVVNLPLKQGNW